jgi:hypothetical protein
VPQVQQNDLGFTGCGKTQPEQARSVRARLQSCRKRCKISEGFSPCGMLFGPFAQNPAFFRSL